MLWRRQKRLSKELEQEKANLKIFILSPGGSLTAWLPGQRNRIVPNLAPSDLLDPATLAEKVEKSVQDEILKNNHRQSYSWF